MEAIKEKEITDRANQRNRRAVQAIVVPALIKRVPTAKQLSQDQDEASKSKVLPEDPFLALTAEGRVIEPPYDMLTLAMLSEHSTELGQCIDSMIENIEGFGYRFVSRLRPSSELKDEVEQERIDLENFFAYAAGEDSFTELRRKTRSDLEHTGNAWWEVLRGRNGSIVGFNHVPSYQMRLGLMESDPVEVDQPILKLRKGGVVEVETLRVWRRFRLHVQSKAIFTQRLTTVGSAELRWFKSFGDPRNYHYQTGELEKETKLDLSERANEVIHFRLYCPRSPYGLPRFIGNLLSIFGDRKSEEINYITFLNNNIPSMALLVSNGQLTEGTINRINEFVESQIQGSDNYSKFLIIEGESAEDDTGEDLGQVKIEMRPLTKEQHTDALFQAYSKNNQDKVRRAFRLPPIFVGRSDDYTRATAESSRRLADEQVFAPNRNDFDDFVNRILFPAMKIRFHRFKSNSPNTTDNTELVRILAGAEKTGGLTPRIARIILTDILGIELPEFPEDFPADVPFSMTMAEAVKNKADPTEPGQQVTALKQTVEIIDRLTGAQDSAAVLKSMDREEEILAALLQLRKRLENQWEEEAESFLLQSQEEEVEVES